MDREQMLAQFIAVTDSTEEFALSFLENADWNYETAVELYLGGSGGLAANPPSSSNNNASKKDNKKSSPSTTTSRKGGENKNKEKIDALVQSLGVDEATAAAIAEAQASPGRGGRGGSGGDYMGGRGGDMDTEMGSHDYSEEDGVRAPMKPKTTRLFGDSHMDDGGYGGGVEMSPAEMIAHALSSAPNVQQHVQQFQRRMLEAQQAAALEQQEFGSSGSSGNNKKSNSRKFKNNNKDSTSSSRSANSGTEESLFSKFKVSQSILFGGSYEQLRDVAKKQKKWIIVNIQKHDEFMSLELNRSVWSSDLVVDMIKNSFVLFQREFMHPEAKKYIQTYSPPMFPHVGIIDPRTRQLVLTLKLKGGPEELKNGVLEQITAFLDKEGYTLTGDGTTTTTTTMSSSSSSNRNNSSSDVDMTGEDAEMDEDDMLQQAMQASLQEGTTTSSSSSSSGVAAPSSITSPKVTSSKAAPPVVVEKPKKELKPEPDQSNPDVVQLQFRLFQGERATRRFLKSQPVSDIFEFVEAFVPEATNRQFDLGTTYPTRSLADRKQITIAEADVVKSLIQAKWAI